MKKRGFLVIAVLTLLMAGCDLGENEYAYSTYRVDFGVYQEVDNGSGYKIVLDNNDYLIPVSSFSGYNFNDGDRILVKYNIVDQNTNAEEGKTEYFINVNSIKKILMKNILDITEANADSIGNDPIVIRDVWLTDSLLNFELKYWGNYRVHFINLVKQPGALTPSSEQPIELELRHNANGDVRGIPYTAFVSFKLNTLKIEGIDSVQFKVTATDYSGDEFDYNDVYYYGENSN